jgi:hypothetical protein
VALNHPLATLQGSLAEGYPNQGSLLKLVCSVAGLVDVDALKPATAHAFVGRNWPIGRLPIRTEGYEVQAMPRSHCFRPALLHHTVEDYVVRVLGNGTGSAVKVLPSFLDHATQHRFAALF